VLELARRHGAAPLARDVERADLREAVELAAAIREGEEVAQPLDVDAPVDVERVREAHVRGAVDDGRRLGGDGRLGLGVEAQVRLLDVSPHGPPAGEILGHELIVREAAHQAPPARREVRVVVGTDHRPDAVPGLAPREIA
jgi:hypothetical protein